MLNDGTPVPLEKRRARRVTLPGGTEALLNGQSITLDRMKVKDISLVGMLIYGHCETEIFSTNSLIDDICIIIPLNKTSTGAKTILCMGKGKIVRSFMDETSQSLCYGVEFIYNSLYLKQRLMTVIETISPDSNN